MSQELIAKLEAAEGPSRELDAEIAIYLGWERDADQPWKWWSPDKLVLEAHDRPRYTSSLDAVRTMLLPGWEYLILSPERHVEIWANLGADDTYDTIAIATAQTVENAFCIAAIRARGEG